MLESIHQQQGSLLEHAETFTTYGLDDGLPSDRIQELLVDRSGVLWIATANGIAQWTHHSLRPITDPVLKIVRCRALAMDRHGNVWIGTEQGPVVFQDGVFRSIELPGSPAAKNVFDLAADGDGMLAATAAGLFFLEAAGPVKALPGPRSPSKSFRAVQRAGEDLWVGAEGGGLWRRRGEEWSSVPLGPSVSTSIYSLSIDHAGTLHVSTTTEGVYFKPPGDEAFRHRGTENGLPSTAVNCVFEDREGNLWVGTDIGGLARLGGVAVTNYGTLPGFPDRCVFGIDRS